MIQDSRTGLAQRATEERLLVLISSVTEYAITMLEPDGRVSDWNRAAERIKGYTAKEIVGSHFSVFYPPELIESGDPQAALQIALAEGHYRQEGARVRRDGSRFWADVTITPVRDRDGQLCGFAEITHDITEARRTQEALRESEERFRLLAENSTDVITRSFPHSVLSYVSPASRIVYGYTPEELVGQSATEHIHPEDLAALRARAGGFADSDDDFTLEYRTRRKDGSYVWVESRARRLRDPITGETIEFQCATRDIAERKLAEEERRKAEQQFRTAFADAPIGMALISPMGRLLQLNQAMCDLVGYDEATLLAKSVPELMHPDDLAAIVSARRRLIGSELQQFQKENRYLRSDGNIVWAYTSISLVRDSDGSPLHFIAQIQNLSERKRAEDALRHAASHDELTGLGNRRSLSEMAARAARRGRVAVIVIDIDQFKAINDTHGHPVGDLVLSVIAERLRAIVPEHDGLVRLGGDEFAILVASGDEREALALGERVAETVSAPIVLQGTAVRSTCGVAIATGTGEEPISLVLSRADACMHSVKTSGGTHRVLAFDPLVHGPVLQALALSVELRGAVERDELLLHYQPIVDLRSRRVLGFEALVRWAHPQQGLIPPLSFIPQAERNGLMPELGAWVLREACRQAQRWLARSSDPPYVSVNLSISQLEDPDFIARFHDAVGIARLPLKQLAVEVTETVLATQLDVIHGPLEHLRKLGVRVHIDDFGTGYSSLSYIRDLPLDGVKLDQTFTRDLTTSDDAWAIARAVVTLLGRLGLTLTAEGVETAAHLAQLRSLGCRWGQGYYFARPQPTEALDGMLTGGRIGASG